MTFKVKAENPAPVSFVWLTSGFGLCTYTENHSSCVRPYKKRLSVQTRQRRQDDELLSGMATFDSFDVIAIKLISF